MDDALETFSTRLLNVRDAALADARRATESAREALRATARAEASGAARARACEERVEACERAVADMRRAFETSRWVGDSAMKETAAWSTRTNEAFEASATGGKKASSTRLARDVATVLSAVSNAFVRACGAIAALWVLFWLTMAFAVMWDDRRLARDVGQEGWRAFTDQILTLMGP